MRWSFSISARGKQRRGQQRNDEPVNSESDGAEIAAATRIDGHGNQRHDEDDAEPCIAVKDAGFRNMIGIEMRCRGRKKLRK